MTTAACASPSWAPSACLRPSRKAAAIQSISPSSISGPSTTALYLAFASAVAQVSSHCIAWRCGAAAAWAEATRGSIGAEARTRTEPATRARNSRRGEGRVMRDSDGGTAKIRRGAPESYCSEGLVDREEEPARPFHAMAVVDGDVGPGLLVELDAGPRTVAGGGAVAVRLVLVGGGGEVHERHPAEQPVPREGVPELELGVVAVDPADPARGVPAARPAVPVPPQRREVEVGRVPAGERGEDPDAEDGPGPEPRIAARLDPGRVPVRVAPEEHCVLAERDVHEDPARGVERVVARVEEHVEREADRRLLVGGGPGPLPVRCGVARRHAVLHDVEPVVEVEAEPGEEVLLDLLVRDLVDP